MTTITVLAAIDYSDRQPGVQFIDLDTTTGIGKARWTPGHIFDLAKLREDHRQYYTETVWGIALFDTEAQLNAAMVEAKKRTELERLVSLECSASKKAWRTGTLQHKAEWRVIRQRLEALQAELEPAGVETVEAA